MTLSKFEALALAEFAGIEVIYPKVLWRMTWDDKEVEADNADA